MLLKPTYFQKFSKTTFFDADIKNFIELAQILSPDLRIVHCGSVKLVIWCHDSSEQIVFLNYGGFQTLEIKEYH